MRDCVRYHAGDIHPNAELGNLYKSIFRIQISGETIEIGILLSIVGKLRTSCDKKKSHRPPLNKRR